jgi:hypothetical protein
LGPVTSLQFDAIGSAAQIDVNGDLNQLTINRGIDLGKAGRIDVSEDLTGSFSVNLDVTLQGGQIDIGRDLSGTATIGGNLTITDGGQFSVGRDLGSTTIASSGSATSGSGSSTASTPSGGGGAAIAGNLILGDGRLKVGGDVSSLAVGGNLEASGTGQIDVAGNLTSLSVGNNLQTSGGGSIQDGGNLGALSVAGAVLGNGSNDIAVGDDLGQFAVLGGATGGSLQNVDINVTKNIQGLDIRNGIFHSLITAGVLIDGGTPGAGSNGWNIGPDGTLAVFDSQILAGFEIRNITIGGDVESDLPDNASGSPTRIVAGEYPQGNYLPGGTIDNFQITGQLKNAVLAASVTPYNGFYPEPAGTIEVGLFPMPPSPPTTIPNDTAPPFANPSIRASEIVLPGGSINPSFIPAPTTPTPGTPVPIPIKSTVLGGVVTTAHINNADYAGIFAADTRGVIVGPVPPILPAGG